MRNTTTPARPGAAGSPSRTRVLGLLILMTVAAAVPTTGCDPAVQVPGSASPRPPSGAASAPKSASTPAPKSTAPATGSTTEGHPLIVFYQTTPRAELTVVPAGAKFTPLETAASSRDGRTLYLGFDIDGGECGTYEVVLEPKRKAMEAGVLHLTAGGRACSPQDTNVTLLVKLSSPLGLRPVVDLATGRPVVAYAASSSG